MLQLYIFGSKMSVILYDYFPPWTDPVLVDIDQEEVHQCGYNHYGGEEPPDQSYKRLGLLFRSERPQKRSWTLVLERVVHNGSHPEN